MLLVSLIAHIDSEICMWVGIAIICETLLSQKVLNLKN